MNATMMSKLNSVPFLGIFLRWFGRRNVAPVQTGMVAVPEPKTEAHIPVPSAPIAPRSAATRGPVISLPLRSILGRLSPELLAQTTPMEVGDVEVGVECTTIVSQLGKGSVKLPLSELKRIAPAGVFLPETDRDSLLVELPLQEILSRLKPNMLPRRASQKQVEVPAELTGPFGGGVPVGVSLSPLTSPPAPPKVAREKTAPTVPPMTVQAPEAQEVPPPFLPSPIALTPNLAVPPVANHVDSGRIPMPESLSPSAPIPMGSRVLPAPNELGPIRVSAQPPPPPEPLISGDTRFISVSLREVFEAWPVGVRDEITALGIASSFVALPYSAIESAVKRGKVIFSWRTIRSWIKPPLGYGQTSPLDSTALELPLKIIVPLFLNESKAATAHRKVVVDSAIPDVFNRAIRLPEPPPPEAVALVPAPIQSATVANSDTNYFGRKDVPGPAEEEAMKPKPGAAPGTSFLKRYSSPNEIVSKATNLAGVAGAFITLGDGLLVSHRLPAHLNPESVAAFLPQIFGRLSQTTKELRMGDLNNLSFTVGTTPWRIFRVGSLFFAAVGFEDQPLPTANLTALAGELDRKEKVS